jgi:hypothetical protein
MANRQRLSSVGGGRRLISCRPFLFVVWARSLGLLRMGYGPSPTNGVWNCIWDLARGANQPC